MSRFRRAPRQVRRRYLAALAMLPLLVEEPDTDPNGLPVLATERIGERSARFSALPGQPRLRVTFADTEPAVLGSVIGLDGDRPELRVSAPIHMDWAATHTAAVLTAAARAWAAHRPRCDR